MNIKKIGLIVCMLFFGPMTLMAQTLYWVPGGDDNWNSPSNWSTTAGGIGGASVPTITNDVVFNSNSFTAVKTITLSGQAFCKNMTWTSIVNTPTLALGADTLTIDGSLTLATSTMSITAGTGVINFTSATGGQNITVKGKTLPTLLFNSSVPTTGGWIFQDAVRVNGQIGLKAGNLNTNGMAVTAFSLDASDPAINDAFSAVSDLTRTLTLGNSVVTLSGSATNATRPTSYYVLDLGGNNLSFSVPGSSCKIIFSGSGSPSFIGVSTGDKSKTLPNLEFGTSATSGVNDIDMFAGNDPAQRTTFRDITLLRTGGTDFFLNAKNALTFGNLTFPSNLNMLPGNIKYINGGVTNNIYNGTVTFGNNCTFYFYTSCTFPQNVTFGANCNIYFTNNLTANGSFTTNTSTVLLESSIPQTVSLPAGQSLYNLTVNNSSGPSNGITLNSSLTVANTLTLTKGYLKTSATNTLILPSGATATGASDNSHVIGPVRKVGSVAFAFPTGDGTSYRPISISAPASSATSFTATYYKANPLLAYPGALPGTLNRISTVEYWTLDRDVDAGGGNSDVQVTLSWNAASQVAYLPSLRVSRYNGTSSWIDHGGTVVTTPASTTTSGSITTGSLNSFSPFTLASTDAQNPLPVSLLTFTGRWIEGQVELNWLTSSEKENAYFEVERSVNGLNYEAIGRIPGSGTTHERRTYRFLDARPLGDLNYYRLRQVDTNGDFELSKVVAVKSPVVEEAISLSPNPALRESVLTLRIQAHTDQHYLLRWSDRQGRECWRTTVHATAGPNQFRISGHSLLPNGLYAVQVIPLSATSPSESRLFKIIVQ